MKFSLILFLVVLGACGKTPIQPAANGIGYERLIEDTKITEETFVELSSICTALRDRDLSVLVNNSYKFDYSMKSCADQTYTAPTETDVTLANVMGGYKFVLKNTSNFFYFQDVETADAGALEPICSILSRGLTSPISVGGSLLFFTADGIPASDCPGLASERCVYLERGVRGTGDRSTQAIITSRDWIRFRLNSAPSRRGFFTYKRNIVQGDCEDGQSLGRQAILK